ncbi:hypothetical protein BJ085DRAFT_28297 [Dimargaris cristalligena]|uniref:Transmembrane protein n=1 Tax=Dimargaris cristalligena TaxID=215637 RepID=A0A4P9ZYZ9_9FUNG|nr:hypothetical protein BJ085DRAFT_28297 [Dimargaris cristalligena]|eukprot:RKP38985.1 hypothetical protein BJ085DRAFT_28297 [Dimargaris cristalligena]
MGVVDECASFPFDWRMLYRCRAKRRDLYLSQPGILLVVRKKSEYANEATPFAGPIEIHGVSMSYQAYTLAQLSAEPQILRRREAREEPEPPRRLQSLRPSELALVNTAAYTIQRWFFFALFALSSAYAVYQLGFMVWRFGLQVNLRAFVYLSTLSFVITTMVKPIGSSLSPVASFFTYLTLWLAFATYLALLGTWNQFVRSFYRSPFGDIFTGICYALGFYTFALCLLGMVGSFQFDGSDALNEFTAMACSCSLPVVFLIKSTTMFIYAKRCFQCIPRDIKPHSLFQAIIKLTAVIIVVQVGWCFLPVAAALFIVRMFVDNASLYLAFLIMYNLTIVLTFSVIFWFLTVHDSIPSLLAFLTEGAAQRNSSIYLYSDQNTVVSPHFKNSPLLSALPVRFSQLITLGKTTTPAPGTALGDTAKLPVDSEAAKRRTVELQKLIRKMSKHSLFRPADLRDADVSMVRSPSLKDGDERPYRIGRFQWERESGRFQQLYQYFTSWGGYSGGGATRPSPSPSPGSDSSSSSSFSSDPGSVYFISGKHPVSGSDDFPSPV